MKRYRVFLVILFFQFSKAALLDAGSVQDGAALESQIDSLILIGNKISPDSPGYVVAVMLASRVIFKKGYGLAELENGTRIGPSTCFNICSIFKQYTPACILRLAQDGQLSLDDDVRKFIPELRDFVHPVTTRHLIYHTSGIWLTDWLMILSGRKYAEPVDTGDNLAMIFRTHTLNFTPGAEPAYNNANYGCWPN